jgi:class 3 adenylate cyclase/tetratricopeptide (TPR) repeat protein
VLCTSCGTENREGRKFCSNCGVRLALHCPACGTPNEPGERFCGECGTALEPAAPAAASPAPDVAVAPPPAPPAPAGPEEERRLVTVLFADLAGFTSMSEGMDPEAVKSLAARCAELMSEEVRRFGGTVSSVMGDAIMAMFGAPVAHEDDEERAIRAGVAIRERIAAVEGAPKRLKLHVGINTGETMAGLIGPNEARDYTAMGDTTNTAARLMSAAPAGSIYIGEKTYLATRHAIETREAEPARAKGKAEPVRVWEVVHVPPVPTERPMGATTLVGRDTELRELDELWGQVTEEGRAGLGLVLGPPGIGKTRLLSEFLSRVGSAGQVLRGRCLAYGEGITYWPVVEMVKGCAGILQDDDAQAGGAKLGALIERLPTVDPDELRTIVTALATLIGAPTTPQGTYEATAITQGELHWGVRRLFELVAAREPLVLVFEDLHWAEPTLLELLDRVTEDAGRPILLLGSARPEVMDSWAAAAADGHRRVIRLQVLTPEESESLVATLLPEHAPAEPLRQALRSAAGNPLFLEETVRMFADAGVLEGEGLPIGEDGRPIPVPGSIQGLIGSRLDLLPAEDRRLAQLASVVGLVFWSGLVSHLQGGGNGVLETLARLEVRDLLHAHPESSIAHEREFAFKHALIRDVAYGRLPKRTRSDLHARCADWVSRLPGSEEDLVEIVAYHLESACRLARELGPGAPSPPVWPAAEALARAAEKAERREGTAEADRFYARALDLVGEEATERVIELGLRRSRTLTALGRSQEVTEVLHRVAEEARAVGRMDLRGYALVGLANVAQKLGRAREARGYLTEAVSIALEVGDRRLSVSTAYESAEIQADFEGEVDGAVDDLWLGLTMAEVMDDLALRIEGHLRMGTVLATAGRLAQAEEQLQRCVDLANQTGSYRDDARATYLLAYSKYYLGQAEEAESLATRAAEWLDRTADRYFQIQNFLLLGRFALTGGDLTGAVGWIRQAQPLARVLGGWLLVEACRYLAEVLVLRGALDEAREAAAAAAEAAPEEDAFARGESLLCQALVAVADEDDAATGRAKEALALLQEAGVPIEVAEARLSLARVLGLGGRATEARPLLGEVRATAQETEARMLVTVAEEIRAGLEKGPAQPTPSPIGHKAAPRAPR